MGHWGNAGCLYISNEVNTKVAEFVKKQPHGGSNPLLSAKSIKIEKEIGACHIMSCHVLASLAC